MRESTPDRPVKPHADTRKRTRILTLYDERNTGGWMPARTLFQDLEIPRATAYRMLEDRQEFGDIAESRSKLRALKQEVRSTRGSRRLRLILNT